MMKKDGVMLFILNISFCCSSVLWPRLKRNSDAEFDYSTANVPISVDVLKFSQPLNHHNPKHGHWNQRYAVTVNFYKKTGPSFLFVNGQGPMEEEYEFPYHVLAYAKHLNAIVFSLEHRFFGRTQPVNGSVVHHLSTAQALADIANFIKGVHKEFHLPKHIKWITFGCSYGGTLAAWARLKFPHLIHGAVVSSAPLLAKVDYYEYEQIVEESLKSYDSKCVESITVAFEEIAYAVDSPQNRIKLSQMFYLNDYDDIAITKSFILHDMLAIISDAVQYNDINLISIPIVCRIMTKYNGTKLEALAEIRKMDMESKDNLKRISEKSQTFQNSGKYFNEARTDAVRYQRCSEFGYFSSYANTNFLSQVKHLLTSIKTDIEHSCKRYFGPNFSVEALTEKISYTNSQYGGLNFNIRNTIFIHGSFDPWYKAGLYMKSNSSLYETIFIKGTSHCTDMLAPTGKNIPELKNAVNKVFKTLHSWLKSESTTISS